MTHQTFVTVLLALLSISLSAPAFGAAGRIKIKIQGIDKAGGTVRAALVDSKATYEDNDAAPVMTRSVKVDAETGEVTFDQVPFGTYALKVFYDENNNEELDTNFIGIPTEKYGFSNNVRSKLGLPGFDKVKFDLSSTEVRMAIDVDHY